ncbi:MAG TPA: ATP-binding protein [Myxococcaceae bacterium]|nr:ATP-binding protein [Myxococcaceae bacterium]
MRLRSRLTLAFGALAVVPLVVAVPLAIRDLRRTLSAELDARTAASTAAARAAVDRTSDDVRRAIEDLAQSVALEEVAREVHAVGGSPQLARSAEQLMADRALTVLSLFDAEGRTLSSGHLPARIGDPDEALFSAARAGRKEPVPARVEIRSESGLRQAPALIAARAMDYGALRIHVVGGVLLDQRLAAHLAEIARAKVTLIAGDEAVASAGNAAPPTVSTSIELPPVARIDLQHSRAALLEAERGIATAFATLVAVGIALALLLGLLVARRITRPVEALTEAAREIASGRLDRQVHERASGEMGELVSAFNRMTADLRVTTEQLVASERVAAWQEVARRLAHELKNPLTPIQMSLETLLAAKKGKDPRFTQLFEESAGAVLEEVERLRRIVDEFSHFARLPKPQLREVDLSELTSQVLALYAAPRPGVEIRSRLEAGVHAAADRDQITQVLLNLMKNAEEALPGGGGVVEVRVARRGAEAIVEVADNGPGIRWEDRPRVLEPYYTTKSGGSGLGLAIAARIAQEHGGRLEVGGDYGRGATFTLVLPAP